MSEFSRSEHGYIGEQRTKAILAKNFWVLTRSVDVDAVDLIIQNKSKSNNDLTSKREKAPELGYVQSKYFEKNNTVRINKSYVDDPESSYRKGFFAFLHSDDESGENIHFFFSSREIQSNWYIDESGLYYCFALTKERQYTKFKNLKNSEIAEIVKSGITDLKFSVESLICRSFISMNSNVRSRDDKSGAYMLARPYGCPTAIYKNSEKSSSPLDPRKDLFPYSGYFEWGYEGTAPRFLATSLLTHFFCGDVPDKNEVNAVLHNLISKLDKHNRKAHIINAEMIVAALGHVYYQGGPFKLNPTEQVLYDEARNKYSKYL